ncbi:MAG: AmmeMemoRadiSam system protein A [Acidobacteria bacterium]|nr:AmmeMemoRadiSam system protein A [Acidobacteriota bacterium]
MEEGEGWIKLARRSVEVFLSGEGMLATPELVSEELAGQAGVFVCIKRRNGDLRGCVGTVMPVRKNIAEEIIYNAVAAAIEDSRFVPVQLAELDDLVFSVDILSPLELVSSAADLDPKTYGVMVESEDGRRGLLLPDLAGIDHAEQQMVIAMRKAKILLGTPVKYYRFVVERISEKQ